MKPIIDHIQITVKSLEVAEPFYDKLMPILGFDINQKSKGTVKEHEFDVIEYFHPLLIFAINSPREVFKKDTIHRRKPGAIHHLAFKAESCDEVDILYPLIKMSEQISLNHHSIILNMEKIIMRFFLRFRRY